MKRALYILFLIIMNSKAFSQSWIDTTLYPFENRFLQLETGNMHYVDEGKGETILFVHGTPTWSFLFRDFIKELSKENRCIAIDHIGFGLSEKPDSVPGTPEWHAQNLSEFIKKMNLQNITLVVHDFGGPIGLAAGIENNDRINKVVLFNAWLWATKQNQEAQKIDKLINSRLGKFMYLNMNFSPKVLLKKGFANKKNLSKKVHQHYIKPFPDKNSRTYLLNLATALVGSSDWYQKQWDQLGLLSNKEWLILWGTKDAFITLDYLKQWQEKLPKARLKEIDSGHFVQEEATVEAIQAIDAFIHK
ncbi:alpha/beta fold hydrolase [Acidiluteibacter ferrifornacis]|uniref:Alpha/beta fold hydrolase n=1 Tax=Acidiluteibacter ferrifornacis TaxID=2692424 RepID=A0A6N9NLX7_9FLAO|nr:alpha/beta fold hydrolase [Acidiluteibacter ferrifornacis]NBG66894.1 alpha/beta fold hydrolase [Acidiluteibacter ferrifornacis]